MIRPVRRLLPVVAVLLVIVGCSDSSDGGDAASTTSSTTSTVPTGCGSKTPAKAGTERLTVEWDGTSREVERVVPPTYDGERPRPLIVSLHGLTSTIEQQNLFTNLPEAAAARGYVLLTPQGAPATLPIGGEDFQASYWNLTPDGADPVPGAQDDVGFIDDLIDTTASDLCVDRSRVYATGFSNGAGMSALLACELPGTLAAIAPVSGINIAPACDDPEPVSVIAFHGDADPLVPYEGGSAARIELENPSVEAAVAAFAEADGCEPRPTVTQPFSDVAQRTWTGCAGGTGVELHTVLGGGHTWPGMLAYADMDELTKISTDQRLLEVADVDLGAVAGHLSLDLHATELMLDFFDAHHLS